MTPKRAVIMCGICVIIGFLAAFFMQKWRYDAAASRVESAHSKVLKGISDAAAQALQDQATQISSMQKALAALDAENLGKLNDEKAKISDLERRLADSGRRLRANATCTASSDKVPGATGAASVGNDAGARLTDAAQRDYFTLRNRIATATSQIGALQDYITNVCLAPRQ